MSWTQRTPVSSTWQNNRVGGISYLTNNGFYITNKSGDRITIKSSANTASVWTTRITP